MSTMNINIHVTETRRRPVRRHVSMPQTELWAQEWWDAQTDPSASVRQLIHEDIATNGITDVTSRPAAAQAASAPAPAPATSAVPPLSSRDADLIELKAEFAELRDKFTAIQERFAPFAPFFTLLVGDKATD